MNKNILRFILIILILLWMCLVFGFSSDNSEESSSLSFKIANFFVQDEDQAKIIEPYIRKFAHLSEYTARADFYFMVCF